MSEGGVAPPPQVFVVDSQASYISMPSGKKSTWARVGQKFLLFLLGLSMLLIFVEGYLIYILYQRTEALFRCGSNPLCHNLSHPLTSEHQDGRVSSQIGAKESNEIHPLWTQKRAFAHLLGKNLQDVLLQTLDVHDLSHDCLRLACPCLYLVQNNMLKNVLLVCRHCPN
ncbi:hypothetical protein GOODEAATRI_005115 [Goodea atripinnis]|uniref:Uncharacterized protein n=1 Tax=Goodea atripinnis TaxID=208336 RepID=A0ABV0P1K2_9TELE